MASFGWHSLSNEDENDDYAMLRFELIKDTEAFGKPGYMGEAYLDDASPANPTIGFGFNLNVSSVLDAVIIKIFYHQYLIYNGAGGTRIAQAGPSIGVPATIGGGVHARKI